MRRFFNLLERLVWAAEDMSWSLYQLAKAHGSDDAPCPSNPEDDNDPDPSILTIN